MSQATPLIPPLSKEQQQQVIAQTRHYIDQAVALYGIKDKPLDIVFNLRGRTSGMYRVSHQLGHYTREIRYNPYIFSKYYDDNFNTTVPHEVAHYISDIIYGLRNIKPHGNEWKQIMLDFNADATVTTDYDLSGIPQKKLSSFTYQCSCREHQLSSIRHNKINRKRFKYYCNFCKKPLQLKTGQSALS
ncbi:MAG TPA: metallopeptidase (SprT family) [Gammaproteobacteria bacterium]|nr:metallopeptidase (SprT family) [Gammaproteobacteria bacterium]